MSDETAPRGGFGKWWLASAVLMAVVALGLVYVLFPRGDATGTDTEPDASSSPTSITDPPSSTGSTAAPEEGGDGWDDQGCNGTSGSSEIPTSPPGDVQWVPLGAISVPVSDEYGPRELDGPPLRQCFQHSPVGALFAAINIPAATTASGSRSDADAVTRAQVSPGAYRDASLSEQSDVSGGGWTVAAFRVPACSPTRCNVDLVIDLGGKLAQFSLSVVWHSGDWLIDGSTEPSVNPVASAPAGFTPWMPGM